MNSTHNFDRLLNEKDVANALNVKVATLRRWRWAGKPSKLGPTPQHTVRFVEAEVEQWLRERMEERDRQQADA